MPYQFKPQIAKMVQKILLLSCKEIVKNNNIVASCHEHVNQVTTNKASSTHHDNSQGLSFQT